MTTTRKQHTPAFWRMTRREDPLERCDLCPACCKGGAP